jgi:glycosyltransferase involved in cell wall biosynthesis
MKILFVTSEFPYPVHKNGTTLINYRLLTKAPAGVTIDLVCTDTRNEYDVQMLRQDAPAIGRIFFVDNTATPLNNLMNLVSIYLTNSPLMYNRRLFTMIRQMVAQDGYDLVYASQLTMMTNIPRLKIPIFLNAIDSYSNLNKSFYEREKNLRNKIKIFLYKSYERTMLLRRVACVNFVSSADAEYVRTHTQHTNVHNITLGIDSNMFFRDTKVAKEAVSLLFSGNFEYKPNVDTAKYIVEVLLPAIKQKRPDTKLYIVGKKPPTLNSANNLIVTGFVENITEWYNRAEIFICPLLYGAGVKNKVLEAMACGLPVISSSVGVSGIIGLKNGVHFILADTKEEQIAAAEKLLVDAELRETIGNNAGKFIEEHYDWNKQIQLYFNLFQSIITSAKY